jgi:hypothetical protein
MGGIQLHWAMGDDPPHKNRDQRPLPPVNPCHDVGVDAAVDRRCISQDGEKTNLTGDCERRR